MYGGTLSLPKDNGDGTNAIYLLDIACELQITRLEAALNGSIVHDCPTFF